MTLDASDFGVLGVPHVPPRNVHEAFKLGVPAADLGFVPGRPRKPPTIDLPGLPRRTMGATPRDPSSTRSLLGALGEPRPASVTPPTRRRPGLRLPR